MTTINEASREFSHLHLNSTIHDAESFKFSLHEEHGTISSISNNNSSLYTSTTQGDGKRLSHILEDYDDFKDNTYSNLIFNEYQEDDGNLKTKEDESADLNPPVSGCDSIDLAPSMWKIHVIHMNQP